MSIVQIILFVLVCIAIELAGIIAIASLFYIWSEVEGKKQIIPAQ